MTAPTAVMAFENVRTPLVTVPITLDVDEAYEIVLTNVFVVLVFTLFTVTLVFPVTLGILIAVPNVGAAPPLNSTVLITEAVDTVPFLIIFPDF